MSAVSRISSLRVSLTLLLLLALASLPFAHRATAQVHQDPAFIAFIQAGGTLSDLCDGPLEGQMLWAMRSKMWACGWRAVVPWC